jgi:hypothetical protein
MSTNQYFLVNKIDNQNYFIIQGPMQLPDNFGPTSGFNVLEESSPELLSDLTWQGNSNLGFWKANFDTKPDYNISQSLIPNNSLDATSKTCNVTYTIKTLTAQELSERVEVLRSQIRMIRDRYLSLTDFTQLSDVPFSTQAKSEFATFRQQLRDLPNTSDPTTIIWPSIPTLVNINLPPFPPVPTYRSS